MGLLMVPPLDDEWWPTLGDQVVEWIERNLVYGPGDLRGEPVMVTDLWRAIIARAYEVFPAHHPRAGRRRFRKVVVVLRKGLAKSEVGAFIALAEAHPEAPVRTIGWDDDGNPIGGGVKDPYIPMVAYTDEQSEELGYGAAKAILEDEHCLIGGHFDIKNESCDLREGSGKIVHLSSSPSARDGARTTFCFKDEIHHWDSPRLRKTDKTLDANLGKRHLADPWSFEVTTMHAPGHESVSELRLREAKRIIEGTEEDPPDDLLFFWLGASEEHDLETFDGFSAAMAEVSGEAIAWTDVDGLWSEWRRTEDRTWFKRVWLNMEVTADSKWISAKRWDALELPDEVVEPGEAICLGFDGSWTTDSTWLVACRLSDGFTWPIRAWIRPEDLPKTIPWEVSFDEVREQVEATFLTYSVTRMCADPYFWDGVVADWCGQWPHQVARWPTNRQMAMAISLKATADEIAGVQWHHNGDLVLRRQVLAPIRHELGLVIDRENDVRGYLLQKPPEGDLIDGAMAMALAHQARREAIQDGALAVSEPAVGAIAFIA